LPARIIDGTCADTRDACVAADRIHGSRLSIRIVARETGRTESPHVEKVIEPPSRMPAARAKIPV